MAGAVKKQKVVIRPAGHADCHAIKAINEDNYGGNDRFLYYFHQDVNTKNTFPYLAEIEGKVVGYGCGEVVEDGELLVLREGRVHQQFQGQNVFNKINESLIPKVLSVYPNLKEVMWTSFKLDVSDDGVNKHPYMKIYINTFCEWFTTHTDKLQTLCRDKTFMDLESQFQVQDIIPVPKREALRLLREEIRFLDFAPVRPMFAWQPRGWRHTTLTTVLKRSDLFITRCAKTKQIQSFCFVSLSKNDSGFRYEITPYCKGGPEESERIGIVYLLHGLREMGTMNSNCTIICTYHYPSQVTSNGTIKALLNDTLGIASNVDQDYTGLMVGYRLADIAKRQKSKL